MRGRRFLKILLIGGVSAVLVGLLAVATFVWNPLEGSYPDLRDAVPRNVDFYLRKPRLADDFSPFPEPVFFAEAVKGSRTHDRLLRSSLYADLNRGGKMDEAVAELRSLAADLRQSRLDLMGDFAGRDVVLAGQLQGPLDAAQWCAYLRVSWKVRLGFGLLRHAWFRSLLEDGGGPRVTPREGRAYTLDLPGAPQPVHAAMVQDLLVVSRSAELLERSLRLARRETHEDSFGRIADYRDEIAAPLARWAQRRGRRANALEFHADVPALLRARGIQGGWPDIEAAGQGERVLSMFFSPSSLRHAMGALLFEEDGLGLVLKGFQNRNLLPSYMSRAAALPPLAAEEWVLPFLAECVPERTALALLLRAPVEPLLEDLFQTLDRGYRNEANQLLSGTQLEAGRTLNGVHDLIRQVGPAFLPQVAMLVRNNVWDVDYGELDCYVKPSPIPAMAFCFWVRPGEDDRVQAFLQWVDRNHRRFGFSKIYTLAAGPGGLWKVREWCHEHIEGTGELAAVFMEGTRPSYFIASNSGPFVKEIVDLRYGRSGLRSILENPLLHRAFRGGETPSATSGVLLAQGERLAEIVSRYQDFAAQRYDENVRDPGWEAEQRPVLEAQVMRRLFPRAGIRANLSLEEERRLDMEVEREMALRWREDLPRFLQESREELEGLSLLLSPLRGFYAHLRMDPQWAALQARLQVRFH